MKRIESFDGRVAVVTGGGSGIGRGIAEKLVAAGATVVVADVDAEAAGRTAADIGAVAEVVDVTDAASVQALADRVVERHGRVDVVVNNAGVGPLATFDDLLLADFHWVMDVNFWGVIHGLKSFLPLLQANPDGGYIVNTASVAAVLAAPGTGAYAASKAAVVAVSEVLAAELGDAGQVGVSILLPGLVRTNINANAVKRPGTGRTAPAPRTSSDDDRARARTGRSHGDECHPLGPPLRVHPPGDRAGRRRCAAPRSPRPSSEPSGFRP